MANLKNAAIVLAAAHAIAALWLIAMFPTKIGYWEAQRDIAYDSIWAEYVSDCDCTESME